MHKVRENILRWAPFAACVVFGVLALSLHHIVCPTVNKVVYLQVPVCMFIPLLFPALERWAKVKVPYFLVVVVAVQIIISVDLGTALNFYGFIPHYDKFLHTYFGVWGAQIVFYFLHLWGGGNMKMVWKLILVLLSVLGIAAIWEIFEFTMSCIISDYDPQLWHAAVASGGNPLWDTMMDIIVAAIGVGIFFVTLLADVLCGGKIYRGTLTPAAHALQGEEGPQIVK